MHAYVALLTIHLHFPEAGSLKGKRKELSSVKAQLQGRLGIAVAEVGHQDTWQRSTLAAAVVAGSMRQLETRCDEVQRFLDGRFPEGVCMDRTMASFSDVEGLG